METSIEPIPYRIRIGVTGHRKLSDEVATEAVVKKAIDSLLESLFSVSSAEVIRRVRQQKITPIAYSIVSPLAEGADRVVARAVLSYEGARLDAVLPLAVDDYLEDFDTEASREEFSNLLARCRRPVRLRTIRIDGEARNPDEAKTLRKAAYESGGHYVVNHCDVLIAIWDGEESRGRGGTAEIVDYAGSQGRPVIVVWNGQYRTYKPGHGLDASALDEVDQFNRLALTPEQRSVYMRALRHEYFEKPVTAKEVPEQTHQLVQTYLFPYYVQASMPAKVNRDRYRQAGRLIFFFSALAVGCVALAVLVEPLSVWCFVLEFVLLGAVWYALRRSHAWHQNWMENRFLAERIRCGIFMALCGVDTAPIDVLPFMGPAHSVNDWMVRVFDEIWNRLPPLPGCNAGYCQVLSEYIREAWIGRQLGYHRDKRDGERKSRLRLERIGHVILPVTMAAALVHIFWNVLPASVQEQHGLHQMMTFIALFFPAVAAALAGMQAQHEHLRLEKRSENMKPQLEYLNRRLASASDPSTLEMLLHEVDEIMLRETQDWLMLMRFAEVKPPA